MERGINIQMMSFFFFVMFSPPLFIHSYQKKKHRCVVLATLDREDEEPYHACAWKGGTHPSVPGEDNKLNVMR